MVFNLSEKKSYSENDVAMLGFHSSIIFKDIEDVKEFIRRENDLILLLHQGSIPIEVFVTRRSKLIGDDLV